MRINSKILSLLLPFFVYSQLQVSPPKSALPPSSYYLSSSFLHSKKTRTYQLDEDETLKINLETSWNNLELKLEYGDVEEMKKVKDVVEELVSFKKIYMLHGKDEAFLIFLLPKGVEAKEVEQESIMFDKYKKNVFIKKLAGYTILDEVMEDVGSKFIESLIGMSIPFGDIAIEIGKAQKEKEKEEETKFIKKTAKEKFGENKYYMGKVRIFYAPPSLDKYEIGRKIKVKLQLSKDLEAIADSFGYDIKGKGLLYFHLSFQIQKGAVGDIKIIKDTISFPFYFPK